MIKLNEITDIKYYYDNIELINPFNFKNSIIQLDEFFTQNLSFCYFFYNYHLFDTKKFDFSMTISQYIQFLDKLYNKSDNLCYICKSIPKYCCGYCHKFFCDSCIDIHVQNCNLAYKLNIKGDKISYYKVLEKINKKNLITDIHKNWKICECNENEVKYFCHHGLSCQKCFCDKCNNDFTAQNFRFLNLDIIFLNHEAKYFNEYKYIEKEIEMFNENIAKLYLEYKDKIENESRKRRFTKHFMFLRNNFIAYQKLKILVINNIRINQNMNLFKLYDHFKNYKLNFKKFEFSNNIPLDKNISRISNFFATQKPIFFSRVEGDEKVNIIKEYLKKEDEKIISQKANYNKNEKNSLNVKLTFAYLIYELNSIDLIKNYINNTNIFPLYESEENKIYGIKAYYIEFDEHNLNQKMNILYNNEKNRIDINCQPLVKLKNGKWVFQIRGNKSWLCILKQKENNRIYEIQFAEPIYNYFELFELKKDKFLIYYRKNINIIDSISLYMNNTIIIPFEESIIEKVAELDNYKHLVFISISIPFLGLILLDYELNQINNIIELVDSIFPNKEFYYFRPFISDIIELKNKKLLLFGSQHYENDYPPSINLKYDFKLIFNLNNFEIELAENYKSEYD